MRTLQLNFLNELLDGSGRYSIPNVQVAQYTASIRDNFLATANLSNVLKCRK